MSDVREWLTIHCPDVQPWQIDLVEAAMAAHREGRRLSVTPARRFGQATARAMIAECLAAFAETEGMNP